MPASKQKKNCHKKISCYVISIKTQNIHTITKKKKKKPSNTQKQQNFYIIPIKPKGLKEEVEKKHE